MARITVIVVSDYEPGNIKTWRDERTILQKLAVQDIREPFDVVFVENRKWSSAAPVDFYNIYPQVNFRFVDETYSASMLNSVIPGITTEYIALMEADSLPSCDWLRKMAGILDTEPGVSAVSGKTLYGRKTVAERVFSLLHRAYADRGKSCYTKFIANNGALYRRQILLDFPYPVSITPFASAWQRVRRMRSNKLDFYFESTAEMIHAFTGIVFVVDYHRNLGYAAMSVRTQPAIVCIPELFFRSLKKKLSSTINMGRHYLLWHDYPLALFLAFTLPLLEILGMLDCVLQKYSIANTAYR